MAELDGAPEEESWLARVYGAADADEVQRTYDAWASDYDDHLASFGYTNFIYAAGLLGRFVPRLLAPAANASARSPALRAPLSTSNGGLLAARVQHPAPDFKTQAVVDGQFKEISLADFKGKYLVLYFYPLDFTFVCPTEIIAFSDR